MRGHERAEAGVGSLVREDVHERVGAGVDGIARAVQRGDVYHRQLAALVRRGDERGQIALRKRRQIHPVRFARLHDQLDVVRPFGDARIDERLRIVAAS